MSELNGLHMALVAFTVFIGGLLRGFAGFGSSLLIVPVLGLVLGPASAVCVGMLLEAVASLALMPSCFAHASRRKVLTMGAAAVLSTPLGQVALLRMDPAAVNLFISGAVTLMAMMIWGGRSLSLPRGPSGQAAAGALCGFLNGFGSIGGPPLVLYALDDDAPAARKRATVILVAGMSQFVAVPSMAATGILTFSHAASAALLAPLFFVANSLGARLFRRTADRTYQRVAVGALVAAAAALFVLNLVAVLP